MNQYLLQKMEDVNFLSNMIPSELHVVLFVGKMKLI